MTPGSLHKRTSCEPVTCSESNQPLCYVCQGAPGRNSSIDYWSISSLLKTQSVVVLLSCVRSSMLFLVSGLPFSEQDGPPAARAGWMQVQDLGNKLIHTQQWVRQWMRKQPGSSICFAWQQHWWRLSRKFTNAGPFNKSAPPGAKGYDGQSHGWSSWVQPSASNLGNAMIHHNRKLRNQNLRKVSGQKRARNNNSTKTIPHKYKQSHANMCATNACVAWKRSSQASRISPKQSVWSSGWISRIRVFSKLLRAPSETAGANATKNFVWHLPHPPRCRCKSHAFNHAGFLFSINRWMLHDLGTGYISKTICKHAQTDPPHFWWANSSSPGGFGHWIIAVRTRSESNGFCFMDSPTPKLLFCGLLTIVVFRCWLKTVALIKIIGETCTFIRVPSLDSLSSLVSRHPWNAKCIPFHSTFGFPVHIASGYATCFNQASLGSPKAA